MEEVIDAYEFMTRMKWTGPSGHRLILGLQKVTYPLFAWSSGYFTVLIFL